MKQFITFVFLLLLCIQEVNAQQSFSFTKDSIAVEELFKIIERNSSYRIYTDITHPFDVVVKANNVSLLQLLENVFANTPYSVSVYGNRLFVLKEKSLKVQSSLMLSSIEPQDQGQVEDYHIIDKANSENRIYTVGDPYSKTIPKEVQVKGTVTDFKTSEPLTGVHIVLMNPFVVATTDADGNYTIKLPSGSVQLEISGFNIKKARRNLMLYGDGTMNIELMDEAMMLDEVVVYGGRIDNVKNLEMGLEKLQMSTLKNVPTVLGEVDILRVIQTLPGVKTVGEASVGFNVRGGATDQNLILFNDGNIYNPNHLFGFFTAFSSEMVKDAEIYKSSIPSRYGGRISSVLDITSKEANKEKFIGSAGIGLVTSNLNLEIPLIKQRTSLLLSGRTTYSNWILRQLPEKSGYNNGRAGFYDLGTTFSHKINNNNNLNVYGYYSHDQFQFTENDQYGYNNLNVSAKWRKVYNEKLISSMTIGYDHYDYKTRESTDSITANKLSFDINQVFAKADFSYNTDNHKFDFGFKSIFYYINPGTYEPYGEISMIRRDVLQKEKALESAIYVGDQWEITPKFSINAGIRYAIFNAFGPRTYYKYNQNTLPHESTINDTINVGSNKIFKTYHGPEFRLSARYMFRDNLSVKAGFNTMQQYIHKLSNTVIMSPTDTWKLSDAHIRPQKGWQVATGLYYDSHDGNWETSMEVYYKKMNNYLDYRSGAKLIMNHHIETDVINTEGHAYGVELSARKKIGKLNGWANYTYSRTFLRQNDAMIARPINNGNWYPTDYDKPHDFKFVGNYKFSQRYSLSVNVDYSTGRPITIPAGRYYDQSSQSYLTYYTDRNSYRIPDFFRTDVSFNVEPNHKLTLLIHSTISIGVYNVTGRSNIYSVYFVAEKGTVKGYQMSIFGTPIPFITYNIKF